MESRFRWASGVVVPNYGRHPIWSLVMVAEYHLMDLAYGVSHGGFRSLEAARQYAREESLTAWDIFHGNARVEYHDPRADQFPGATDLHPFALSLCCCCGPITFDLPPLLASLLSA
jgi:hypothetical protein